MKFLSLGCDCAVYDMQDGTVRMCMFEHNTVRRSWLELVSPTWSTKRRSIYGDGFVDYIVPMLSRGRDYYKDPVCKTFVDLYLERLTACNNYLSAVMEALPHQPKARELIQQFYNKVTRDNTIRVNEVMLDAHAFNFMSYNGKELPWDMWFYDGQGGNFLSNSHDTLRDYLIMENI